MIGVGYFMIQLYAFCLQTRAMELLAPSLRLPLVLATGGLLFAVWSGTIVRGFNSKAAIVLLLLTAWFVFGVPFSSWPGGALSVLLNVWLKNWTLFILIVALVNTRRRCARMVAVLAVGSTVAAVCAIATTSTGAEPQVERLALEGSSLNDPNTLGMTLLMGLPMWMTVIGDRSRYMLTRLLAGLCTLPILAAMPMTGSRGTLVGFLVVVTYLFKRLSIVGKTGLLVVVSIVVILTGVLLAEDLLLRYTTITDTDVAETGSGASRVYLFKQGMRLIARNPITGVGFGMFAVAENYLAIEQGLAHGTGHTVHNMFLQVASEGGIPAFILYLMILWTVWKTLGKLETVSPKDHPRAAQIVRLSFWLKVTFLAFCTCGLFLSVGLSTTFVSLAGLSVALARVAHAEMHELGHERSAGERPVRLPRPQLWRIEPDMPLKYGNEPAYFNPKKTRTSARLSNLYL
jgi:O-antigen ligase